MKTNPNLVVMAGTLLATCLSAGTAEAASATTRSWRFWNQQAPAPRVSAAPMEWTVSCPNGASIPGAEGRAMAAAVARALDALCGASETRGAYEISIVGHTDASGSDTTNIVLGAQRAASARRLLENTLVKMGAEGSARTGMSYKGCRIVFRCYSAGSGVLADPARPASAVNRRVEVELSRLRASKAARVVTGAAPLTPAPDEPETWREFPQEVEKPIFDDGINY